MARVAVVVLVFRLERVDLVRASVGVGRPEPVADRRLVQIRAEVHVNAALRGDRLRRPRRFEHDEVVDRAGAEVRGIASRQVVVVVALRASCRHSFSLSGSIGAHARGGNRSQGW